MCFLNHQQLHLRGTIKGECGLLALITGLDIGAERDILKFSMDLSCFVLKQGGDKMAHEQYRTCIDG